MLSFSKRRERERIQDKERHKDRVRESKNERYQRTLFSVRNRGLSIKKRYHEEVYFLNSFLVSSASLTLLFVGHIIISQVFVPSSSVFFSMTLSLHECLNPTLYQCISVAVSILFGSPLSLCELSLFTLSPHVLLIKRNHSVSRG